MVVFKKTAIRVLQTSSASRIELKDSLNEDEPSCAKSISNGTWESACDSRLKQSGSMAVKEETLDSPKAWIKKSYIRQHVGVIVSDMSGFTRLTRAHGILHFASIIMRMRQLCLPILHFFEALFITTEADNFLVVFPTVAAAVEAAYCMQRLIGKYNAALPPDKSHFALTLNGVGVECGEGPLVDMNDKLHGPTFSRAYALGEDLCEKGSVLVTGNVRAELEGNIRFGNATFLEKTPDESVDFLSSVGGLFDLTMSSFREFDIPSVTDDRYLPASLVELTMRHLLSTPVASLEDYDSKLRKKYMHRRAVLMFEFEFNATNNAATEIRLEFECLGSLKDVFIKHHALEVEDVMYMFQSPCDAVLAALQIRQHVLDRNMSVSTVDDIARIMIKGFGVHLGDVLWIENTDVHWGDPINTASKLGQDLAKNGDIIISDVVYEAVRSEPACSHVRFTKEELSKSNVTFTCYKVNDGVAQEKTGFAAPVCCDKRPTRPDQSRSWLDFFCISGCACEKGSEAEVIGQVVPLQTNCTGNETVYKA